MSKSGSETGGVKPRKKQLTLSRIRAVARDLFYEKGFHETSVAEIAKLAGVQRATVYLHYKKKEEIIIDLVRDDLSYQLQQYQQLANLQKVSRASLKNWLIQFSSAFDERRESIPLYSAVTNLASELSESVDRHRATAIEILGKKYDSFDLDALGRADRNIQRVKCYMVIFLIESCTTTFNSSGLSPSFDQGANILVESLYSFLTEGSFVIS